MSASIEPSLNFILKTPSVSNEIRNHPVQDLNVRFQTQLPLKNSFEKHKRFRSLTWKRRKKEKIKKKSTSSFDFSEAENCSNWSIIVDDQTPTSSNSSSTQNQNKENEVMLLGPINKEQATFTATTTQSSTYNTQWHPEQKTPQHKQLKALLRLFPLSDEQGMSKPKNELNKRCLFGLLHITNGAKLCLIFYIFLNLLGILAGTMALAVWALIPLIVVPMTFHAFSNRSAKFFIPLLIVMLIQSLVCVILAIIVTIYSLANLEKVRILIAISTWINEPSVTLSVILASLAIFLCFLMAFIFLWQAFILASCIHHYDYLHSLRKRQATDELNRKALNFGKKPISHADKESQCPRVSLCTNEQKEILEDPLITRPKLEIPRQFSEHEKCSSEKVHTQTTALNLEYETPRETSEKNLSLGSSYSETGDQML